MNTFRAIFITVVMFVASVVAFATGDFLLVALVHKQSFVVATIGLGFVVAVIIASYSFREWMRD